MLLLALLAGAAPGCADDPEPVTWHRDVAPLVDAYCAECHRTGGVAPFPLATYEDAVAWAEPIRAAVVGGTMPPWAAADGCQDYRYDTSLDDAQIQTFADWIDGGAPEGDPADAGQAIALEQPALDRVDLELTLDAPYDPDFADGPDEYRCFVLGWPLDAPTYATAG